MNRTTTLRATKVNPMVALRSEATAMNGLLQDFRYALRQLRKSPGFTTLVVITLALGIGANTAIFSVIDAVLLRPLPYKDAGRLVAVWENIPKDANAAKVFDTYRDFEEWKTYSHSFEELGAANWAHADQTLIWRGHPQQVVAIYATSNLFSLLGASALRGRTFEPQDENRGCTVVLSNAFWQDALAGYADIVGRSVALDDKSCTVVGVMPRGFTFYPRPTSLWILLSPHDKLVENPWEGFGVGIFGRLRPGVSRASAQTELTLLHSRLISQAPATSYFSHAVPEVYDLQGEFTWLAGRNLRTGLVLLFGAAGFILLIACVNVASLLLGKAFERQKELAVRSALGSGRSRLVRQLLTENLLFSLLGAIGGALIAIWCVAQFRAVSPIELPPGNPIVVDIRVLGFTIALAVLAGMLFGFLPAWRASRVSLNEVLKDTASSVSAGLLRSRTGRVLVIAEAALSVVLLSVAGLLIRSVLEFESAPVGFDPDHLLAASVKLPAKNYSDLQHKTRFYERLISSIRAIPRVQGAAVTSHLPLSGPGFDVVTVEGQPVPAPDAYAYDVCREEISSDYLQMMRIPLLEGREFSLSDQEKSEPVAMVNQAFVERYFPQQDPIGKHVKMGRADEKVPWLRIVGVTGNVSHTIVFREMGYVISPFVFRPLTQSTDDAMSLVVRASGNPLALAPVLQRAISDIDSSVPLYDVKSMDQIMGAVLAHPRFRAALLGAFAAMALLLVAVGLYGVLSQSVVHRTREIGIRMALGADPHSVLRLTIWHGMVLALLGLSVGLLCAVAATRLLASLLYGVRSSDPLTLIFVAVTLSSVCLFACFVPARRAAKVDPMIALRYE
jgi:putative ABC transport system permease protein